jgi:hypothetical protein
VISTTYKPRLVYYDPLQPASEFAASIANATVGHSPPFFLFVYGGLHSAGQPGDAFDLFAGTAQLLQQQRQHQQEEEKEEVWSSPLESEEGGGGGSGGGSAGRSAEGEGGRGKRFKVIGAQEYARLARDAKAVADASVAH